MVKDDGAGTAPQRLTQEWGRMGAERSQGGRRERHLSAPGAPWTEHSGPASARDGAARAGFQGLALGTFQTLLRGGAGRAPHPPGGAVLASLRLLGG